MKLNVLIFALVVFAFSACTQYTCPTYSKLDVKQGEKELVKTEKI